MHSTPDDEPDLRSVVTHAEAEAERLLDTAGTAPLDVVAWLSAHIAAMGRAVYPVARDIGPDGQALVTEHHDTAGRLTRTLRVIERHYSGDALASGLSSERLFDNVRALTVDLHATEDRMVDRLAATLSPAEQEQLMSSYESALEHAPTRPHPHLSRGGLIFRIDGLRDRILDAMDGRHVPVPRLARRHITPGRWGSYLLGQPHDRSRDAG
jgi:hypothetical protein